MPVYEYECLSCGHKFEQRQETTDSKDSELKCSKCGDKKVRRVFSPFSSRGGSCAPDPRGHS